MTLPDEASIRGILDGLDRIEIRLRSLDALVRATLQQPAAGTTPPAPDTARNDLWAALQRLSTRIKALEEAPAAAATEKLSALGVWDAFRQHKERFERVDAVAARHREMIETLDAQLSALTGRVAKLEGQPTAATDEDGEVLTYAELKASWEDWRRLYHEKTQELSRQRIAQAATKVDLERALRIIAGSAP